MMCKSFELHPRKKVCPCIVFVFFKLFSIELHVNRENPRKWCVTLYLVIPTKVWINHGTILWVTHKSSSNTQLEVKLNQIYKHFEYILEVLSPLSHQFFFQWMRNTPHFEISLIGGDYFVQFWQNNIDYFTNQWMDI